MVFRAWLLLLGAFPSSGFADARELEDRGERLAQLGPGGEVLLGARLGAPRPRSGWGEIGGKSHHTHEAEVLDTVRDPHPAAYRRDAWTSPPALQEAAAVVALRDAKPHDKALPLLKQVASDTLDVEPTPAPTPLPEVVTRNGSTPAPPAAQGPAAALPTAGPGAVAAAASPDVSNSTSAPSSQARQPLARKEIPLATVQANAAAPGIAVVEPEESRAGVPSPPTHGYSPHPLLVSTLVTMCLVGLMVANSWYGKQPSRTIPPAVLAASDGAAADGLDVGGADSGGMGDAKGLDAAAVVANADGTAAKEAAPEGGGKDVSKESKKQSEDSDSDDETLTTERLSEDTYGMAIASMVRDMSHLMKENGSKHRTIRAFRIGASVKLLLMNMLLQIFLLVCIANFAAARAVWTIRSAYSDFETHMYAGHIYESGHGNARGLDDKYFNTSLFDTLPEETKGDACRIPFAQPYFLFAILLVWSLLVVGEIKESAQLFERLVASTASTASMADATQRGENGRMVIVKLTLGMKAWVACFIVLPRIVIASILLWLGCRWLSATTDFQNLVLNAVGLEFVLLLKVLLYRSLVPQRVKRDTVRMHVVISHEATRPSPLAFLGTFLWGFVAMAWVYLYIFCIQGVLPGFRWDVHDVCAKWMKDNFAGWS